MNVSLAEDVHFTLYSPRLPKNYPVVTCIWLIRGPLPDGFIVFSALDDFWFAEDFNDNHDYLEVGIGHNVTVDTTKLSISRNYGPANSITINGSEAFVRYVSYPPFIYDSVELDIVWRFFYGKYEVQSILYL